MPEHWPIHGFDDLSQMTSLFEAISLRESCRSFASAPSTRQWNALLAAADTLALPGVRIALGMCDTSLFQPFMGLLMKFENVQRFAAVIVRDDTPAAGVNAGLAGELLTLSAVADGLAGVWVAGTYKRGSVGFKLAEGEKIVALIPLGAPKAAPKPPLARKRKELAQICTPNFTDAPLAFREAARAVQAAPSAMNRQPWLLAYEPEGTLTVSVKRPGARVDLGIALCHAMLALGRTADGYTLSSDALSARITLS